MAVMRLAISKCRKIRNKIKEKGGNNGKSF
jgi:hypothetical protein